MIIIKLTANEVCSAAHHALMRRVAKVNGERYQEHRVKPDKFPWDNEIEAACAEIALAKHFGVFWSGLGELGAGDAGEWEARWTRWLDTGKLTIYPKDPDNRRYVLIDGVAPTMRLIGWLYAGEAKAQQWWIEDSGYWQVPRAHLKNSFEEQS